MGCIVFSKTLSFFFSFDFKFFYLVIMITMAGQVQSLNLKFFLKTIFMNNAAFKGQLGIGERCIDATLNSVRLIFCPEGNNRFQYIKYIFSNNVITKSCLIFFLIWKAQWSAMALKTVPFSHLVNKNFYPKTIPEHKNLS